MDKVFAKIKHLDKIVRRRKIPPHKIISLVQAEVPSLKKELARRFRKALTAQFEKQRSDKGPWKEMKEEGTLPRASAIRDGYYYRGYGGRKKSRHRVPVHPNAKRNKPLLMLSGLTKSNIINSSFKVIGGKLIAIEDLDFDALDIGVNTASIIKEQKKRGRDCTRLSRALILPIVEISYAKALDRVIAQL